MPILPFLRETYSQYKVKVIFIYSNFGDDYTLNVYRKMTPGRSGKWKDMEAVLNRDEADFHIVIDRTHRRVDPKKTIYISAHPMGSPGYYDPKPEECVASINYKDTSGFLEWWIDYDYDTLSRMNFEYPQKTKNLCCIVSNSSGGDYQRDRMDFIDRFCGATPLLLDLYGRMEPTRNTDMSYKGELGKDIPDNYWIGKEILRDYRYSLEFDAYCKNYFSERFADAMLLWCMPLYSGGTGLEKFFPENSFRYVNVKGNGDDVREIIKSNFWEENIEAMKNARHLILNKYQLWPKVYDTIKSL